MSFILVDDESGSKPQLSSRARQPSETVQQQTPSATAVRPAATVPTPAAAKPAAQPKPTMTPMMARARTGERRWSRRDSLRRDGKINFGNGASTACVLLDISQFGASIEVVAVPADDVADAFVLIFTSGRIRSEATCLVRWRLGNRIGVHFAGPVRTYLAIETN